MTDKYDRVESSVIQPIDKTSINQICSGQVVLSLAIAVKELLENSIDAGATLVQIKLEEYGSESIEVIDNGCGVEEVNFQALTLKHHTSKLKNFNDLYSVETYGFRGEALSSLCTLSDVTIVTQHENSSIGSTLKFDHNGIIIKNIKTCRKTGTTVKLENLFGTLPIRRTEFLKNIKREFSKMCNVLYAYGLQCIGVRITCSNTVSKSKILSNDNQNSSNKKSYTLIMDCKGSSVESNIISIFGLKQKEQLLKIIAKYPSTEILQEFGIKNLKMDIDTFQLEGYISSCSHKCGRASSDRQFYYINSRPIDNPKVSKLVNNIYHQFNNQQDPFVLLNIKVKVGSYDMNVTPDKRQILIQHENLLFATLKESLLATFDKIPSILKIQNIGLISSSEDDKEEDKSKLVKQCLKNFSCKANKTDDLEDKFLFLQKTKNQLPLEENKIDFFKSYEKTKSTCNNIEHVLPVSITIDKSATLELSNETANLEFNKNSNVFHNNESKTITKIEIIEPAKILSPKKSLKNSIFKNSILNNYDFAKQQVVKKNEKDTFNSRSIDQPEEIRCKRMKLDDGLTEEDKIKRKNIMFTVNLEDIKNAALQIISLETDLEKNMKTEINFFAEIKPQNNERAELELKRIISKESFSRMQIIGQFNLGFIITKLESDLFIVDQHASDEKYNFEMLQSTTSLQTQKMVNPEKLELTADKEELMLQHQEIFKKNGFDFIFDKNEIPTRRISLTSIPISKNCIFGKEDVDELLFLLEDAPENIMIRPTRLRSMFASRACRKSVMIGTPLSQQEMKKLIVHMGEIESPWNCPHGRPTMRHLINLQMIISSK